MPQTPNSYYVFNLLQCLLTMAPFFTSELLGNKPSQEADSVSQWLTRTRGLDKLQYAQFTKVIAVLLTLGLGAVSWISVHAQWERATATPSTPPDYVVLRQDNQSLHEQLLQAQTQITGLRKQVAMPTPEVTTLRQDNVALHQQLAAAQAELTSLKTAVGNLTKPAAPGPDRPATKPPAPKHASITARVFFVRLSQWPTRAEADAERERLGDCLADLQVVYKPQSRRPYVVTSKYFRAPATADAFLLKAQPHAPDAYRSEGTIPLPSK